MALLAAVLPLLALAPGVSFSNHTTEHPIIAAPDDHLGRTDPGCAALGAAHRARHLPCQLPIGVMLSTTDAGFADGQWPTGNVFFTDVSDKHHPATHRFNGRIARFTVRRGTMNVRTFDDPQTAGGNTPAFLAAPPSIDSTVAPVLHDFDGDGIYEDLYRGFSDLDLPPQTPPANENPHLGNPPNPVPRRFIDTRLYDTACFPEFTAEFFVHGRDLVPVEREIIYTADADAADRGCGKPDPITGERTESWWQIVLSPGQVWREKQDQGMSRASFPFVLNNWLEGVTSNGIATFVYDDHGVSHIRYQIVQQVTGFDLFYHFVGWGRLETADFAIVGDRARVSTLSHRYRAERKSDYPMRELGELRKKLRDRSLFDQFVSAHPPDLTMLLAVLYKGKLYTDGCPTPYGPFPYCRDMRHGTWSVQKTATNSLTMMRLAQKYGERVYDDLVVTYLDDPLLTNAPTATPSGLGWPSVRALIKQAYPDTGGVEHPTATSLIDHWYGTPSQTGVTFLDLNNMASGIGNGEFDDNTNENMFNRYFQELLYNHWYLASSREQKLFWGFAESKILGPPGGEPGTYRYRDQDAFAFSASMDALHKVKQQDNTVHVSTMMDDEVFAPIGISALPRARTREQGVDGQVPLGIDLGAYCVLGTVNDYAKIATLIANRGEYRNRQLLHRGKVNEILAGGGKPNGVGDTYLRNFSYRPLEDIGDCAPDEIVVPEMHGFGGQLVAILPHGAVGILLHNNYYESEEAMTDPVPLLKMIDDLKPICRGPRRRPGRH